MPPVSRFSLQIQAHDAILRRHGEGFETSPAPNRNGSYEDRVMAKKPLPSPEVLRQLLRYEPDTGKLFWRKRSADMFSDAGYGGSAGEAARWNGRYADKEAIITQNDEGYFKGRVGRRMVTAHRVIWAMQTGGWPVGVIDHADGDTSNNRWGNLREASHSQNAVNSKFRTTNTSGARGVTWSKSQKKWRAAIRANGQGHHLGSFDTVEAASEAYTEASIRLHGAFSRTALSATPTGEESHG